MPDDFGENFKVILSDFNSIPITYTHKLTQTEEIHNDVYVVKNAENVKVFFYKQKLPLTHSHTHTMSFQKVCNINYV